MGELSHLDSAGRARMVDVSEKETTNRLARAQALVRMSTETATRIKKGDAPKGDVMGTARIAGIQAAKRAHELIPLAHPLPLAFASVDITLDLKSGVVTVTSEARTAAQTGVEMEALVACSIAALAIYDMVKGIERGVTIERIELLEKTGGKEDWVKPED